MSVLEFIGFLCAAGIAGKLSLWAFVHFISPRLFPLSSHLLKYRKGANGNEAASWALITGATDGIGLGFAQELAAQGFNIVLLSRSSQKLENAKSKLLADWPSISVHTITADASDVYEIHIKRIVDQLHGLDLSILVNNVGTDGNGACLLGGQSPQDIADMINVNCLFPTQLTAALISLLSRRKHSAIINMSSLGAVIPLPYLVVYSATKSFNRIFSTALAKELASNGIAVLTVMCGYVPTKLAKISPDHPLACSTNQVATGSLSQLGWVVEGEPHWIHSLNRWVGEAFVSMIPPFLAMIISDIMLKSAMKTD